MNEWTLSHLFGRHWDAARFFLSSSSYFSWLEGPTGAWVFGNYELLLLLLLFWYIHPLL
jgi:hypothetical protein